MKRSTLLLASILLLSVFTACADDPVTPPPDPNLGKLAPITLFHAHNDLNSVQVVVRSQDTIRVSNLAYGRDTSIKVQIGTNSKLSFSNPSGSTKKEIEAKVFDSLATWAVFSGSGSNYDAFTVSTPKITLGTGKIGVRVINATENVSNKIQAWIDDVNGARIGDPLDEKTSTGFTSITAAGLTKFVITDNGANPKELLSVTPQTTLEAGKLYSIIVYGSGATSSTLPLVGKLVVEP